MHLVFRLLDDPLRLFDNAGDTSGRIVGHAVVGGAYSDGTGTVEMHHVSPVPHSNGLIIAYIPKEKVLFQGDFALPAAGQPANDHIKPWFRFSRSSI